MSKMEDVLDSVYRIVYRWARTSSALTSPATVGSTTLNVESSIRFRVGDTITIHDGRVGENDRTIASIPDNTTIELEEEIEFFWPGDGSAFVEKTLNNQFVKHIFVGEPAVIGSHQLPAIFIMGNSRSSEWLTIGSTKERYELQIGIFVEDSTLEDGYRFVLQLTDAIQEGLKKNIFPLVGDFTTHNVTFDVNPTDEFIKVNDTTDLFEGQTVIIENLFTAEELNICEIIDSETIRVHPMVNNTYTVATDSKIIGLTRFIYNSWPAQIDYGFRHKGTLMKGAVISWFAEEQEIQTRHGWDDPQLS